MEQHSEVNPRSTNGNEGAWTARRSPEIAIIDPSDFFLNLKFITWGVMADHGSYFITMLHGNDTTGNKRKRHRERRR